MRLRDQIEYFKTVLHPVSVLIESLSTLLKIREVADSTSTIIRISQNIWVYLSLTIHTYSTVVVSDGCPDQRGGGGCRLCRCCSRDHNQRQDPTDSSEYSASGKLRAQFQSMRGSLGFGFKENDTAKHHYWDGAHNTISTSIQSFPTLCIKLLVAPYKSLPYH